MLNADARAALTQLVQRYHSSLDKKRADLMAAYHAASESGWNEDGTAVLKLLVHRMAGSAASYGFADLGDAARMLDQALQFRTVGEPPEHLSNHFDRLTRELDACLRRPPPGDPHAGTAQDTAQNRLTELPRIVLVDDDPAMVDILTRQLMAVGFDISGFTDPFAAMESVGGIRPACILMDLMFSEGEDYGFQIAEAMVARLRYKPGLVYLSQRTDVRARQWAVDSGADAFFTKPVNVTALAQLLEQFVGRGEPGPIDVGRIAIIEDDVQIGQYYSTLLEGSGFRTALVSDPVEALERLLEFRPDLVLMDMQMPDLDGIELTQILRQHESLFDIPVIFLTSVSDPGLLRGALRAGADALLSKGDDPELILSVIQRRIQRFRRVTYTLTRDPLTRLYNRPALMERVSFELQRAQRDEQAFCIAAFDIDGYRELNETHGRSVGDHVLREITEQVRARLRHVDVVGRYGGAEIMIVMPSTRLCSGEAVMNELTSRIAEHPMRFGELTLNVSVTTAVLECQLTRHDSAHSVLQQVLGQLEALLKSAEPNTVRGDRLITSAAVDQKAQGGERRSA